MIIEETLRIALEAHEGQKDLDGRPAVLHPIAVGLMELRGRGVDEDVLAALRLLTHAKTEDYFDYVRRIAASGNTMAIHVKINDLRHNLERGLRTYAQAVEDGDKEKAERLARINDKHRKALCLLEAVSTALP